MEAIPGQFPISLRVWPSKDDKTAALPSLISRINNQRGSFRSVTEEALEEELKRGEEEANISNYDGKAEEDEEEDEEPARLKKVSTAREEILGELEQAHNAAMFALDFISLLLSKDTPVQASLSISTALRDAVSLGTLGADKVHDSRVTKMQKQQIRRIASGWKLQSLTEAVDSVLASATRLEKEIEKETKYWEQILAVDDNGWAICRLPQEKHTLGVRFGFVESAPAFSNRSLGALRRNAEGTVHLDQGVVGPTQRRLRVRIMVDGLTTGTSSWRECAPQSTSIESLILTARNTIYEEELWQELHRESRVLANQGVRVVGTEIYCSMTSRKDIVLDLVSVETENPKLEKDENDKTAAEMISLALHLLLSHSHGQNLRRRSQMPLPITNRPPPNLPYNLLRPILGRLHHESIVSSIVGLLGPLTKVLSYTGVSNAQYSLNTTPPDSIGTVVQQSLDKTLDALISNLSAEFNLPLTESTQSQSLNIRLKTILFPNIETRFHITTTGLISDFCKPPPNPLSVEEVKDYVLWATACALAAKFSQCGGMDGDEVVDASDGGGTNTWNAFGWQSTHNPTILRMSCNETDSKEIRIMATKINTVKEIIEIRADFKHVWGGDEEVRLQKKSSFSVTHVWRSDGAKYDSSDVDAGVHKEITLEQFMKDGEKWTGDSRPAAGVQLGEIHDADNGFSWPQSE